MKRIITYFFITLITIVLIQNKSNASNPTANIINQKSDINFDPGLKNTAFIRSSITLIDGENGTLQYKGMDISDLCEREDISFVDVALHLISHDLENLEFLKKCIIACAKVISKKDLTLIKHINSMPKQLHPMNKLQSILPLLKGFYLQESMETNPDYDSVSANSAILYLGKMPLIVATLFRMERKRGPIDELTIKHIKGLDSYEEIFMNLMFGQAFLGKLSESEYKKRIRLLKKLLIIHADHGQNASTTTARVVASAGANMSACLSAAVGTLSGPAHGGANQAVIEMLESIEDEKNLLEFLEEVKQKQKRLMGFGHRVYKNMDPRAAIIKAEAEDILKNNKLFKLAKKLEEAARADEYFKNRKLYPNVDFYSGLIYNELGIPKNMFTVMFAASRIAGWCANIVEQQTAGPIYATPIVRPKQIYVDENQT